MPQEDYNVREATVVEMIHRFRHAKPTSRSERDKLRAIGKAPKKMWYENNSDRPPHPIFIDTVEKKELDFEQQNNAIDFSQTQMMFQNKEQQTDKNVEGSKLEIIEPKCILAPLDFPKQSRQTTTEKPNRTNSLSYIASKDSQNVETIEQKNIKNASLAPPIPWRERFRFSLSDKSHAKSAKPSTHPNPKVQNSASDLYSRIRMQPNASSLQKQSYPC